MRLLEHRRLRREVLEVDRDLGDLGLTRVPPDRLERAGTDQREPGLALPADLDVDRVAEGRARPDEGAVALFEVDEVPVQAGVEPGGEAGRDIGGQHRRGEEHRVVGAFFDHLFEHVHAGLWERRLEGRVVRDPDLAGAVGLAGECGDPGARDHAVGVAERRGLGQHAERALLDLTAVVLEEDEGRH